VPRGEGTVGVRLPDVCVQVVVHWHPRAVARHRAVEPLTEEAGYRVVVRRYVLIVVDHDPLHPDEPKPVAGGYVEQCVRLARVHLTHLGEVDVVDSHLGNALVSFGEVAICFGYGDVVILVCGGPGVRERRLGIAGRQRGGGAPNPCQHRCCGDRGEEQSLSEVRTGSHRGPSSAVLWTDARATALRRNRVFPYARA